MNNFRVSAQAWLEQTTCRGSSVLTQVCRVKSGVKQTIRILDTYIFNVEIIEEIRILDT